MDYYNNLNMNVLYINYLEKGFSKNFGLKNLKWH